MKRESPNTPSSVLFIPHGGGPLPLLGDPGHRELINFLQELPGSLIKPSAILVISAHWEEAQATITSGKTPALIHDYYGFPAEAYRVQYPAPGNPALAERIFALLQQNGIDAKLDGNRGFDHGLFVPLKIMFPDASIPCVQLSLLKNLDPQAHIGLGKALSALSGDNLLILGSGFSFHNLPAFFAKQGESADLKNKAFEDWLIETCTSDALTADEREKRLTHWSLAPHARYCHPREEHLLPLHVCFGLTRGKAELTFNGKVLGKNSSAFLWR